MTNEVSRAVDNVTIPGEGAHDGKTLRVLVCAELMKSHLELPPLALADGSERDVAVARSSAGDPMIFYRSDAGSLMLLQRDAEAPSGWSAANLFAGAQGKVVNFDLSQDREHRISFVIAVVDGSGGTELYQAPMLSADAGAAHWKDLFGASKKVEGIEPRFSVEVCRQDFSHGDSAPVAVAIGKLDGAKYFYVVDAPNTRARMLELPENADPSKSDVKIALSLINGDRCASFLYSLDGAKSLVARVLSSKRAYDFSAGNNDLPEGLQSLDYTCLSPAAPRKRSKKEGEEEEEEMPLSSDMFVGAATGVYVFREGINRQLEKVAERVGSDGIGSVLQITVAEDGNDISVWALCAEHKLWYIRGERGDRFRWYAPVLFATGVVHIAALRSQTQSSNEIFIVDQELNITHHYQDPTSTLWQRQSMRLKGSEALAEVETFTTQLSFHSDTGMALHHEEIDASASDLVYATINGRVYRLTPTQTCRVKTDDQGDLTIILLTKDIAPPLLHFKPLSSSKTLSIRPNAAVFRALSSIESADDLRKARTRSGAPVLSSDVRPATDGYVPQLALVNKTASAGRSSEHTFVEVGDKPASDALQRDAIEGRAMIYQGGKWVQSDVEPPAGPGNSVGGATGFVGDLVRHAEMVSSTLDDATRFFVQVKEGGVRFISALGDLAFAVLDVVVTSVRAAYQLVNGLLKKVGIDLDKVVEWLGFVFDWKDMWHTHRIIASLAEGGIEYGIQKAEAAIEDARTQAHKGIQDLLNRLDNLTLSDAQKQMKVSHAEVSNDPASQQLRVNPGFNDLQYKIKHGRLLTSGDAGASSALSGIEALEKFALGAGDTFQSVLSELKQFLDQPFSVETIVKVIATLGKAVLSLLDSGVDLALDLAKGALGQLRELLIGDLDVPLLGSLYRWAGSLAGESNAKLTLARATGLLVAIPLSILSKMARGESFFAGMEDLDTPEKARRFLPALFEAQSTLPLAGSTDGALAPQLCSPFAFYGDAGWGDGFDGMQLGRRPSTICYAVNENESGQSTPDPNGLAKVYRSLSPLGALAKLVGGIAGQAGAPKVNLIANAVANMITYPLARRPGEPGSWLGLWCARFSWFTDVAQTGAILLSLASASSGSQIRGGCKAMNKVAGLAGQIVTNIDYDVDAETWICDCLAGVGAIVNGAGAAVEEPYSKTGGQILAYGVAGWKGYRTLSKMPEAKAFAQRVADTATDIAHDVAAARIASYGYVALL